MKRYYFTGCDLRKLSKTKRVCLQLCKAKRQMLGQHDLCAIEGDLCHIEFECDEDPCRCAGFLEADRK